MWYLAMAEMTNQRLEPARDRVKVSWDSPPPDMPFLADADEVLSFLDAERPNLLPVARHAAQHGHLQITWQSDLPARGLLHPPRLLVGLHRDLP